MARTRLGSFNVENLFDRPRALMDHDPKTGAPEASAQRAVRARHLAAHAAFNELADLDDYDVVVADGRTAKELMLEHLATLELLADDTGPFARLRKIRGRFLSRKKKPVPATEIVASGRADWVGWCDLLRAPVDQLAMQHTAMVMRDVGADVLGVVEAESRPVLGEFTNSLLQAVGGVPYDELHLFDGNDARGIDVGLLATNGHRVTHFRTHVYDRDAKGSIFSRDCAEYHLDAHGEQLVVLVNHLKSKGYSEPGDPQGGKRRFRQAARIAVIYNELMAAGVANVAVVGDLNDSPDSDSLEPLFDRTTLTDISEHPAFDWGGPRKGTYGSERELTGKIDYVLLSPDLFAKATGGGVFRTGIWRGNRTKDPWPIYPTMTAPVHAASDHAAIYADIDWSI